MKMGTHRVCLVWWILGRMGKKMAEMFSPHFRNVFSPKWGENWVGMHMGRNISFSLFIFSLVVMLPLFFSFDFPGPRRDSCLSFFFF